MNAEVVRMLADLVDALAGVAIGFVGILLGYWMGRNSAERPFVQNTQPAQADQGSTEEPGGDIFTEAMVEPPEKEEKGIPTIIGDKRLP